MQNSLTSQGSGHNSSKSSILMGFIREMPGVSLKGQTSRIIQTIGKDLFFLLLL